MMPATIEPVAGWLVDRLLVGSVQGLVLVGLAWLACRRRVKLSAAMQAALWWAVLLKMAVVFVPLPAVPIPILPARSIAAPASATFDAVIVPALASVPASGGGAAGPASWELAVAGTWLLCIGWSLARLLLASRATQAVVRAASPSDHDVERVAHLASMLGLATVPDVRVSGDASAPQVVGVIRPVVLLPGNESLASNERLMAVAHELMHIKRRDVALGWVPAIAERLFFFHPCARVASREYAIAREAACDAAVIRALKVPPEDYGRLLVRFGVGGRSTAFAVAGASSSPSSLRRRLDMLQHLSGNSRGATAVAVIAMAIAIAPSHLVARTARGVVAPAHRGVDVELPTLMPAKPAEAPAQAAPAEPGADRSAAAQREVDKVPTADAVNDRLVEMEKVLRDLETRAGKTPTTDVLSDRLVEMGKLLRDAATGDADQSADLARREIDKARAELRAQVLSAGLEARAQAARGELAQRDQINEYERQLELLRKQWEAQGQALEASRQEQVARERELERALRDQPAARDQFLRQRLEELSRRLEALARMQRQLQLEAEQLKRELAN